MTRRRQWYSLGLVGLTTVCLLASSAEAQVASGLLDPNVATEQELAALPHMNNGIVKALLAQRPLMSARALVSALEAQSLTPDQVTEVLRKAFVHVDLNRATAAEFMVIPGAGKRMAHEFEEYRPWTSFAQFDREIGKYVDESEVQRLKSYTYIPLDLNGASEAEFRTIPGVGRRMAHEFEEYRPWTSESQFRKEIGKYVDEKEVARLWRYVTIK
jgi:DNA uptake protein ComE-like DNA-binding protein